MRLHTGVKPLKCYYCGMKFRTSGHRKTHIAKHFKVQNLKDLAQIKKEKSEVSVVTTSNEEATDIVDIVDAPGETSLTSVDVSNEFEGINSVMISPDGTVMLQLNGMNLDPSSLLNFQTVGLDDAALDPMQYCNTVSLEFAGEAVDERGENAALSINPNVLITQQREDFVGVEGNKSQKGERRDFEVVAGEDHTLITLDDTLAPADGVAVSNQQAEFSLIPYLPPVGASKCLACSKTFVKQSDWHEHMSMHNILVKVNDPESGVDHSTAVTATGFEGDPLELSIKKGSSKDPKRKLYVCPYQTCLQSFKTEKEFQFHVDTAHPKYECLVCKEVFATQASYQHHLVSQHCARPIKCVVRPAEFPQKDDDLLVVQSQDSADCSQNGILYKSAAKGPLEKDPSAEGMTLIAAPSTSGRTTIDEDTDPLMIRDIFLTSQ